LCTEAFISSGCKVVLREVHDRHVGIHQFRYSSSIRLRSCSARTSASAFTVSTFWIGTEQPHLSCNLLKRPSPTFSRRRDSLFFSLDFLKRTSNSPFAPFSYFLSPLSLLPLPVSRFHLFYLIFHNVHLQLYSNSLFPPLLIHYGYQSSICYCRGRQLRP